MPLSDDIHRRRFLPIRHLQRGISSQQLALSGQIPILFALTLKIPVEILKLMMLMTPGKGQVGRGIDSLRVV